MAGKTLHKADIVGRIVEKTGGTKKDVEAFLKAFADIVAEELANGNKVSVPGLGVFYVGKLSERTGINPKTKEKITIPSQRLPRMKASTILKKAVNA